jgi:hypothetical protein
MVSSPVSLKVTRNSLLLLAFLEERYLALRL